MARMSLIDYQLHCRMEEMFSPGESRHQAKQEYKEMMGTKETHNRTVSIHSHKTYDAYKQTSIEFVRYMKKEYKEIKDVRQVKEKHVIEYLQNRQKDEKSAYTISKDMAALNKLFNFFITKKDAGIKERSYKDITRSRLEQKMIRSTILKIIKIRSCFQRLVDVVEKVFLWLNLKILYGKMDCL